SAVRVSRGAARGLLSAPRGRDRPAPRRHDAVGDGAVHRSGRGIGGARPAGGGAGPAGAAGDLRGAGTDPRRRGGAGCPRGAGAAAGAGVPREPGVPAAMGRVRGLLGHAVAPAVWLRGPGVDRDAARRSARSARRGGGRLRLCRAGPGTRGRSTATHRNPAMNRAVTTLVLVLLAAGIARAQVPVKERQFVYGINAFAWEGYAGSLSARPAHTIYVLAGHRSIVSARETLVYFWPITGEYRADWSGLNASVAGALEVFQAGRAVTVLPRQSYVIQYPNGPDSAPDGQIVEGSQRSLVAFSHRREAVGFTIVPQTRWTVPERSDEPASTIYARPDQVLYFQPFAAREYNELAYAHLTNPQSAEGRSDGWRWEYTQSLGGSRLQV